MFKRLAVVLLVACGDDEPATTNSCEADSRFITTHNSCKTNADCVVVGACSGQWGFAAVSTSAQGEARERSQNTECVGYDGPTYTSECSNAHCTLVPTGRYCGQPIDSGNPDSSQADASNADASRDL